MKKVTIIAKFAFSEKIIDGQTVKSKIILESLEKRYGKKNIESIDTYNWKKNKMKLFKSVFKAFKESENIIMMPAQRGLIVFSPILVFLNMIYKRKLHYIVIGSWLYKKLKVNFFLKLCLIKFDFIYSETSNLCKRLQAIGFDNVYMMKNYKPLEIETKILNNPYPKKTLKMCIFSRINYEKGIEDAINALLLVNSKKTKIELDVYGPIDDEYNLKFHEILKSCNKDIKYCGIIKPFETVKCVKKYDYLLFPTRYYTEGIPGTIIDAFAAAVPVIVSKWENCEDIVLNDINGIIYDFQNFNSLCKKIKYAYNNQDKIYSMKKECIKSASLFCSIDCLKVLFENIDLNSNN